MSAKKAAQKKNRRTASQSAPPMTKGEALAFRERWRLVNAREEEELRSTPIEVKWQQFNTLLAWGQQLGWTDALAKDVTVVRERWARLRKAYRG
jgi:hypothetical protein